MKIVLLTCIIRLDLWMIYALFFTFFLIFLNKSCWNFTWAFYMIMRFWILKILSVVCIVNYNCGYSHKLGIVYVFIFFCQKIIFNHFFSDCCDKHDYSGVIVCFFLTKICFLANKSRSMNFGPDIISNFNNHNNTWSM